ncbi:STAS domain-containing protein [Streptomyces neyagawaensis]|uniref:STAS domain-containing protein n=1 Tax=Streptomyces neyagawaensis TaxID=42238 RepID=UPI0006E3E2B9|nr:STAS domain-containing protein [Streptomyces neyagawaensis]MCL6732489.1 STAS domain-containing protein [Streptomyces neyagawaensis]MDE1687127.1 STAS domain-containing protein [Streptomyces neyagawaensis]
MSVAQNPLSIKVDLPREDAVLLTIEGELDIDTATELQHHLANQLSHGRRHFLLDVSAVPFMDSSGMNIILRTYQEVREIPGGVYLIAPTPAVRRILDLTGVSLTVATVDSVDEALEAVDSGRLPSRPDEPSAEA